MYRKTRENCCIYLLTYLLTIESQFYFDQGDADDELFEIFLMSLFYHLNLIYLAYAYVVFLKLYDKYSNFQDFYVYLAA